MVNTLQELFADKKYFTQQTMARNVSDTPVTSLSPKACKWCLAGGFNFVYGRDREDQDSLFPLWNRIIDSIRSLYPKYKKYKFRKDRGGLLVRMFNDYEGYDAVVKVVKDANV